MDETIYLMLRVGTLAMALSLAVTASAQVGPVCQAGPGYAACERAAIQGNVAASERQDKLRAEVVEASAISSKMLYEAKQGPDLLAKLSAADLAGYVATVQAQEARLAVLDKDLGRPVPDWTAANASLVAMVAKENACRADKKCMIDRQAAPIANGICLNLGNIRVLTARIAAEKANPSGVVDLADLHSSGEDIQIAQANVTSLKAQYAKLAGKTFEASVCR